MKPAIRKLKILLRKAEASIHNHYYGNCAVLLYHRVTSLKDDPQQLCVSPENFKQQLHYLKQNDFRILSSEKFHYHLVNKKKFPAKSIFITFDDGYADNFLEALPILEEYNTPALIYIATGTLNTSHEYWWDTAERILIRSSTGTDINYCINGISFNPSKVTDKERLQIYHDLLPFLRSMPSIKREAYLKELAGIFSSEKGRISHRALTYDELRKLSSSPLITIGAHTHLHPSLAALTYQEQLDEISTSKELLEKELSTIIKHFSYPFGTANDFNDLTIEICQQLEFESVAANIPALVRCNSGTMNFPRFLVRNWNAEEFSKNLKSFFQT